MAKRDWKMTKKEKNIYSNLYNQAKKIYDFRTHHQGARGTERYREGVRSFCKHLAIHYKSKNFKNISDKHLKSFVEESKKCEIGASTIKTDLAAVRKLHDMLPKKRHELKLTNKEIGAEKRKIVGVDRAWSDTEAQKAVAVAKDMGRKDVEWSIRCARTLGTRLEEVTALTKTQIRDALMNGHIHLKNTKGGIPRDVPLNKGAERVIREMLSESRNERVFTGHGQTHKQAMKSIQNWIANHRASFVESVKDDIRYREELGIEEERMSLTMHGLRHSYARWQYKMKVDEGLDEKTARKAVAELLGHGRDQVTRIYLGK
ncbi:tyrosine-type recombinase/integrase [Bacillus sp. SCS-151]|uniref:tyrosine-type recombinase/integrase n=1 Tax=Nanhaiella sioensis TaxID=3115293 RepID=UPI00397BD778